MVNRSGRYTRKTIINLGKAVKVAGTSKQIDFMRNTDCQKRPNLYHVIEVGCSLIKMQKKTKKHYFSTAQAQLYQLMCLLSFVVFVWRCFLFPLVLGMGCIILLWHTLCLPYNYFNNSFTIILIIPLPQL